MCVAAIQSCQDICEYNVQRLISILSFDMAPPNPPGQTGTCTTGTPGQIGACIKIPGHTGTPGHACACTPGHTSTVTPDYIPGQTDVSVIIEEVEEDQLETQTGLAVNGVGNLSKGEFLQMQVYYTDKYMLIFIFLSVYVSVYKQVWWVLIFGIFVCKFSLFH